MNNESKREDKREGKGQTDRDRHAARQDRHRHRQKDIERQT